MSAREIRFDSGLSVFASQSMTRTWSSDIYPRITEFAQYRAVRRERNEMCGIRYSM